MARAIDSEVAFRFLTEQFVKETGAFSKGVNKGLNIARSAMRNPDAIPTLTPPNEPLTCGLVDRHGMPLRAGDTVAADKFLCMQSDTEATMSTRITAPRRTRSGGTWKLCGHIQDLRTAWDIRSHCMISMEQRPDILPIVLIQQMGYTI